MISPIWTAVVGGLLLAAIVGIGVIAALDFTGVFREAIGAPETPVLVIAAVLVLQLAVLLSAVVIRGRRAAVSR